jgi:hypothetical protein
MAGLFVLHAFPFIHSWSCDFWTSSGHFLAFDCPFINLKLNVNFRSKSPLRFVEGETRTCQR